MKIKSNASGTYSTISKKKRSDYKIAIIWNLQSFKIYLQFMYYFSTFSVNRISFAASNFGASYTQRDNNIFSLFKLVFAYVSRFHLNIWMFVLTLGVINVCNHFYVVSLYDSVGRHIVRKFNLDSLTYF